MLTSSPLTCAARGISRAMRDVIVVLPAPGIPVTITHPDTSSLVTPRDVSMRIEASQSDIDVAVCPTRWEEPAIVSVPER